MSTSTEFVARPVRVEAIQFTPDTFDAVVEFCTARGVYVSGNTSVITVARTDNDQQYDALSHRGDWIVIGERVTGVVGAAEFEHLFQPASEAVAVEMNTFQPTTPATVAHLSEVGTLDPSADLPPLPKNVAATILTASVPAPVAQVGSEHTDEEHEEEGEFEDLPIEDEHGTLER